MRDWFVDSCRLAAVLVWLWLLAVTPRASATPAANDSQPYVTGQLAEDGDTDDGPAINACMKSHPGRHIMLLKAGGASYGGGQATSKDIYSSQTLTMVGDAQWLDCNVPALWAGGCRIDFDPALKGPGIAVSPKAYGVEISNLEFSAGQSSSPPHHTPYHPLPITHRHS